MLKELLLSVLFTGALAVPSVVNINNISEPSRAISNVTWDNIENSAFIIDDNFNESTTHWYGSVGSGLDLYFHVYFNSHNNLNYPLGALGLSLQNINYFFTIDNVSDQYGDYEEVLSIASATSSYHYFYTKDNIIYTMLPVLQVTISTDTLRDTDFGSSSTFWFGYGYNQYNELCILSFVAFKDDNHYLYEYFYYCYYGFMLSSIYYDDTLYDYVFDTPQYVNSSFMHRDTYGLDPKIYLPLGDGDNAFYEKYFFNIKFGSPFLVDSDYTHGLDEGYTLGYTDGKRDGINESGINISLTNLLLTVADIPMRIFYQMFNFDMLGISLFIGIFSVFTIALVVFVVKKVV